MRKLLLAFFSLILCTAPAFAEKRDKEKEMQEREATVNAILKMLDERNWTFVPQSTELPSGIRIDGIIEDNNYFRFAEDGLLVRVDYFGANLSNSINEVEARRAVRNIVHNAPFLSSLPDTYNAACAVISQEVKVSKNKKSVDVSIEYEIIRSNYSELDNSHHLEIYFDTKSKMVSITCYGMHYEEKYFGYVKELQ